MNQRRSAVKGSKVRNHGIPVMLGKARRIIPAMLQKIAGAHDNVQSLALAGLLLYRLLIHLRQCIGQLILCVFPFRVKADALHADRLFLAVIEPRKAHDAGFVDTDRIAVKLLHQLLLDRAKTLHPCRTVHKVVDVQGFSGLYHHRRRQRECVNLCLLLLESAVVHLEKLGVDAGDCPIVVTAVVHHEENAAILRVVLFERFLDAHVFPALTFQFCSVEHAVLPVLKYTEADGFSGIEQAAEDIHHRDVHINTLPYPAAVQESPAAWLPRFPSSCRRKFHRFP